MVSDGVLPRPLTEPFGVRYCRFVRSMVVYCGRAMGADAARPELGLADFGRIIWRRKWSILLLGVLAGGAAFGADTSRTKVYQGTAQLLVTPTASQALSSVSGSGSTQLSATDIETAAKVISSPSDEQAAAAILRLDSVPAASVSEVGATNVVEITVQSPDASLAVKAANAYAQAYVTGQRNQAVSSLEAASTQVSSKLASLGTQINALQQEISGQGAGAAPPTSTNSNSNPQVSALQAQESSLIEQQTALREQLTQIQDSADLSGGGGQLIGPARLPATLVSPKRTRDTLLATAVGLVLGLGLAFLREYVDDRIRSEDDLRMALGEVPTIGLIPMVKEWLPGSRRGDRRVPHLVAGGSLQSRQAAEAYRSVRTAIQFIGLDRDMRTLVVTSPLSNEGKSTTVANLAAVMAQAGRTVVVLSCDLRRPQLHEAFGVEDLVGYTSVILGEVSPFDALQQVPGYENLWILTAGPLPPNPSELLASRRTEKLIDLLGRHADVVIIDTPPVLPVTDASLLAGKADATVLVMAADRTTKRQARQAAEVLRRVDVVPAGVIVTRVPERGTSYSYGYGYGYEYSGGASEAADAVRTKTSPIDRAKVRRFVDEMRRAQVLSDGNGHGDHEGTYLQPSASKPDHDG